jgi:VWFA-related protein
VQVTLLQIDAVALDTDGKTVADLKQEEFTMTFGGAPLAVSHVDVTCPIGAMDDPLPLKDGDPVGPLIAPGIKRRIVFAFDYSYLDHTMRAQVLDAAAVMLRTFKTPEEEVMIVALASEVRVEQRFTTDVRHLLHALERMKNDVTLWAREYPVGATGKGYFGGISTLMDVMGSYDGSKAVILFSQASNAGDPGDDVYYRGVAAHAAASHSTIYPAKPDLLTSGSVGNTLSRLANESGGRMPFFSNDLSLPYRRAQRDLSCRYTVGAYIDPVAGRDPKRFGLAVTRPGVSLRAPETVQLFTEASKQQARVGAAYVDPGPFERPLVRAFGFPSLPAGGDKWETLLAINFPVPVGPKGTDVDVKAALRRGNMRVDDYKRRIHVAPPEEGATARSVTMLGDATIPDGQYGLTVVLTDAGGKELVAAKTDFTVPPVPADLLILRGPVLGRVVPGGLFLRANPKEKAEKTRLGQLLGPGNGFEPLLVEEIAASEKLLVYWTACVSGTSQLGDGVMISRSFRTSTGETAYAFPPVPLKLEDRGKGVSCQDKIETLPPGTLAPGDYHLDVVVAPPEGEAITQGTTQLHVQ